MKKLCFSLLLVTTLALSSKAQLTGYMGKKYIVHADLASSALLRGADVGIELAWLRTISFTIDASIFNKSNYQEMLLDASDYETGYNTASIHSRTIAVGLRIYPVGAYNAPKGPFTYIQYGWGTADMTGYSRYDESFSIGGQVFPDSYLHKISVTNIPVSYWEYGAGTQYIFNNTFTIETSIGFTYSYFDAGANSSKVALIAHKYGANLIRFSDATENAFGMSCHLKISYLF